MLPERFSSPELAENLPDYVPLSHNNPFLTAPVFDPEEFLLSRARTTLPELRAELRDYLLTLKEELVQLINNDYEAFISLSTDLRNENSKLKSLRGPLGRLQSTILESRTELQLIQDNVQEKLHKRSALREEKTLLQSLLKISESVTRLESLLSIASPDQEDSVSPANPMDDASEERGRSNRAKHIARVAAEYMQLLYHVSKAREESCAFIDVLQWRIDRVHSTLSSDLDHLFATLLASMSDTQFDGRLLETERLKFLTDLRECLRVYDVLGLWRDAEDVLRRDVVRPFLKKTIHHSILETPRSPAVPQTPFKSALSDIMPSTGFSLRTPYTPFTASVSCQNFAPSHMPTQLAIPPSIEDIDNPLAQIYNQILRFVSRHIRDIMEIAEKISNNKMPKEKISISKVISTEDTIQGFQILAYVVWEEIANAIINDIGDVVFTAGRPDELRKNYEATHDFLRCLELCAPSAQAIHVMRGHDLYHEFDRRWQLPVYFQLRWKEIVVSFEETLSEICIEPSVVKAETDFLLAQTASLWKAVTMCWSPQILIPELSHRFWRLTLQLLNRYAAWLRSVHATIDTVSRSTASANTPTETSSAENIAADEILLQQYVAIITDLKLLENKIDNLWEQEIRIMFPPEVVDIAGGDGPREVLKQVLSKLITIIQPASAQIISILTKRCCEALLPVRSIPSQFRAMSSKRLPTEPSHFVQTIFRAIKAFFAISASDGPGRTLKDAHLRGYSQEIFDNVAQRYILYLAAMRKTEESLRRLKKGKKSTFSLFGSTQTEDSRDEERIQMQMILDVEAFGKEAQFLGIEIEKNEHYAILKNIVLAHDQDAS